MTTEADILPGNAKPVQRAIVEAFAREFEVPIPELFDPEQCPAKFLPFLATHEGVDLWFDDWTEARKRQIIAENSELSRLKGTHAGAVRLLEYVDAEVIDTVAYPARFVLGQSALGISPINHPPFRARFLIKVTLERPVNAFRLGQSALGQGALREVDYEPIRRAKMALRLARAPEAEYRVTFAWRRPLTFRDAPAFSEERTFGAYTDRTRL